VRQSRSLLVLAVAISLHALVVLALRAEPGSPLAMALPPTCFALLLALIAALSLALVRLTSWQPVLALTFVAASALVAVPRVPLPAEPPLDQALTLTGIVIAIEPDGRSTRALLAEPIATVDDQIFELDRPIRATFDYLDAPLVVGSAIAFQAELGRPRVALNPTTTPREPPPLFASAKTLPTPDPRSASWSTLVALDLRERLTFESASATALFRALILGDRSELDAETRYAYQDTGTAHLLAISGMNLALVGWGLFRILLFVFVRAAHTPGLRRLGPAALVQGHRPRLVAAVIALAVTAAYTAIIAQSDATDRALAALALTFGGILLFRATSTWRTLGICFFAALLIAPEVVLHAGFQLSFAATASLVIIAPHTTRIRHRLAQTGLHPWLRYSILFVATLAIADVACFLATAPLTIAWFGQLPTHSLWVNLVAIPFMGVVFPAGMIWLLIALAIPPLGDLLAPWLALLGDAFNDFIRMAGDISGSASTEAWPLALGVLACLSLLVMMRLTRNALRLGTLGLMASTALAFVVESPPQGLELIAFDVGHGDALGLRLPDGTRVLVDTGGKASHRGTASSPTSVSRDPNRQIAERILVPALRAASFSSIDLLIITHSDLDHVGAASALAERIPIRHLWIGPCARRSRVVRTLVARLEASGTMVHDVALTAPVEYGGATFELLSPEPDLEREDACGMGTNDASLVLSVTYAARRILLTGDIESTAEEALLARARSHPEQLHADVLKVPHHGSRTSSTEAFLDAVSPRLALVSGLPGKRPPPHPAIMERYAARHIETLVTGTVGAVSIRVSPDGSLTNTLAR